MKHPNSTDQIAEDLSSDGQPGQTNGVTQAELEREFVRPGGSYSFKGVELWPFCTGGEILFNQVRDDNDAALTTFLIHIFIHVKRGGKEAADDFETHMVPICWDRAKFRGAFLRWLNSFGTLSNADRLAAMTVFEEMRGWARKSSVVPTKTLGGKKKGAKSRPRRRS